MRLALLLITLILAACPPALGGITLPLGGACKVGRFIPVTVDSLDRVKLTADGCVPVDLAADNQRVTIPILVTGVPGPLKFPGGSLPLHLVASDELLIGTTDPSVSLASLFPDRRITPIRLDPTNPLPGPPAAWETLDAICLDSASLSRLTDEARSTLLAGEVEIVATSPTRPDDRWPWVRRDRFWILVAHPAGPIDQIINPDVYSPVSAWTPGRTPVVQATIVLLAILTSLAVTGVCLWRSRWRTPVVVVGLLIATGGVILWRQTLDPVATGGGDVLVIDGPLVQRDSWVFQRGLDTGVVTVPFDGWTHPVFSSPTAMAASGIRMSVTTTSTAFTVATTPDALLAFVHRSVLPEPAPQPAPATSSTMQDIAKAVYLNPGNRFSGDGPTLPGRWTTAVVERPR